jgi:hypothetical protein
VGVYPTGLLNASVSLTPDGPLFLVNLGLMTLVHKVSKILLRDMVRINPDEPDKLGVYPPRLSEEQMTDLVATFAAYVFLSSPTSAARLASLGGVASTYQGLLVSSVEVFVSGHEYGHMLGGHLQSGGIIQSRTGRHGVELVELLQNQELEADRYGLRILLAEPRPDLGVDLSYDFVLDAVTMGAPCFFFALDDAVRRVTAAWAPTDAIAIEQIDTHPASQLRSTAIKKELELRGLRAEAFQVLDDIERWLTVAATAIGLVGRDAALQAVARRGP